LIYTREYKIDERELKRKSKVLTTSTDAGPLLTRSPRRITTSLSTTKKHAQKGTNYIDMMYVTSDLHNFRMSIPSFKSLKVHITYQD